MQEHAHPAPLPFAKEVEQARERGLAGKLGLLAEECQSYPWRADAHRLLSRAQATLHCTPSFDQVVLFTGHMIDTPGRAAPRFPESAAEAASAAILQSIRRIRDAGHGTTVGIAGGASGGDILFHEACARLSIPTLLRLTLRTEAFVQASVAPAGLAWVERFHALTARLGPGRIAVLGPSIELPVWLTGREHYNVWQRTNLWIVHEALALAPTRTLLALWDGQAGDSPGGTGHLVQVAPEYGISVAPILNPATLTQHSAR